MHHMMKHASPQAKWTMFVILSGFVAIGSALLVTLAA